MLKILIKKQITELFKSYFVDAKTGKPRSKKSTLLFIGLYVVLILILGVSFYGLAGGMAGSILGSGVNWIYFVVMGLVAIVLGVFGSVFNTYASVYLPKDNELLLSMPIPVIKLLASRLAGVCLTSVIYSAVAWIPGLIAYWLTITPNVKQVIFPILLTLIIGLFVSVLSSVLGFFIAVISTKTKGKSIVRVIFSLLILAVYYFVYFKAVKSLNDVINHINQIGDTVKSWFHYIYLLSTAADGNTVSMIAVTAITLVLSALCFAVLAKTFLKLTTAADSGSRKVKNKDGYNQRTVEKALVMREFKHFTSVSTWMLNGAFGLIILVAGAVTVIIKCSDIRTLMLQLAVQLENFEAFLPVIFAVGICTVISMDAILAVSVSIEGKTLWQIQSLPVKAWDVLKAKEKMGIEISVIPAMLFAVAGGIVIQLGVLEILLACCVIFASILFISDFHLFLNLKMPNLVWTNEATLTKRSMPVVISLFAGWGFFALLGFGGYYLCAVINPAVVLAIYAVIIIALRTLVYRWIKAKGSLIFESL